MCICVGVLVSISAKRVHTHRNVFVHYNSFRRIYTRIEGETDKERGARGRWREIKRGVCFGYAVGTIQIEERCACGTTAICNILYKYSILSYMLETYCSVCG